MKPVLYAAVASSVALTLLAVPSATAEPAHYKNCTEVREAGKAPLHKDQPGYRAGLDRDGDGIACEVTETPTTTTTTTSRPTSSSGRTSTTKKSSSGSSSTRGGDSYSQVGSNDVPVGGVATGG